MILAVAVVFLDEERFLPRLLDSIASQTRSPDQLLLVDDGSRDASPAIARRFAAEHPYARVLLRERRERQADRLAAAAELLAFQWAVEQLDEPYDVIAKMDGDLELTRSSFESIIAALERDPGLGIAGLQLCVPGEDGQPQRERSAVWHVRGATKFYRRACWQQISPLPTMLGWDTIDEARARIRGWRVEVVDSADGAVLHLRPTGSYDGGVRGFRRRGVAAWAYGAHPLAVLVSAAVRLLDPPKGKGSVAYLEGWLRAASRRDPRAEPEVLRFVRREQLGRIRDAAMRRARR
jgi:poly-beta-1,6-N-acetyl-D-glucosamine synthase